MSKVLVAYFSAGGTTERAAKAIAEAASADMYRIRPAVPYVRADLNWMNSSSRTSLEMNNPASRPAIDGRIVDVKAYDVIFLGFPIWWYVAPHIINTFLESYDFSGKRIILFATSGGSGFGETVEGLKGSVAADTLLVEGKILNGRYSSSEIKNWVDGVVGRE